MGLLFLLGGAWLSRRRRAAAGGHSPPARRSCSQISPLLGLAPLLPPPHPNRGDLSSGIRIFLWEIDWLATATRSGSGLRWLAGRGPRLDGLTEGRRGESVVQIKQASEASFFRAPDANSGVQIRSGKNLLQMCHHLYISGPNANQSIGSICKRMR
ncbi:hypothetical protein DAI22_12g211400 [Oryza sativa Japonica Group]|nr:hypothetical protein DAI22_12g211400 [Oryza sativa Japonica Group]